MLNPKEKLNLPAVEEEVLAFWKEKNIFKKSLKAREGGPEFVFYEGPPTANARPGTHHMIGRAMKDIIPRYKQMRGYHVPRRAGWDTHGLPVEIEVEKELGIKSKPEIETYGIAAFNAKAKASVWKYKEEWERLTERVGFWLDIEKPYITYDNAYVEKLWSVLKKVNERGLLYKGYKVVPWCTRCGTALSSHELAQGYKEVTDTSAYVSFELTDGTHKGAYVVAWTTTPWTLLGNVALAVNPAHTFVTV
ncbi:MAG: isoleucine--tRNA ligase, partial [Candidatus Pacebacteria bacterium]|nr:isoleucine--tRNA ligase [Candidatus Paceibacterota bacterium]